MRPGGTSGFGSIRSVEAGARVARIEVFFDLVFVYAFFNIARSISDELNLGGLVKGLLLVALLWLCWISHMLVAQRVRFGEGFVQLVAFAVMAAVTTIALAIPHAFDPRPTDPHVISGPLLFAASYLAIRALHHGLHWYAIRPFARPRRQLMRLGVALVISVSLLFAAALLPYVSERFDSFGVKASLWAIALLIEYGNGLVIGLSGFRVAAPGHFVERFELIIIIVFGELIISIGLGSGIIGQPVTWAILLISVLGIVVIAILWWSYFDLIAPAAALALHGNQGQARTALARDGYMYLHLPMITGLMLLALAGEDLMAQFATGEASLLKPLHGISQALAYAGTALYLLSLVAFQLRVLGTLLWSRLVAVVLFSAGVLVANRLSSLVALGLLGGILIVFVVAEIVLLSGARRMLHQLVREEREAHEARETEWRRQHR